MKRITSILLSIVLTGAISAQTERNLLEQAGSMINDSELLVSNFNPLPSYSDRSYWNNIPKEMKEACIKAGENSLHYEVPSIPLTAYLEYKRSGKRNAAEQYYTSRRNALRDLVLAELSEGKGRFIDAIANVTWSYCEMTTWSNSAHLSFQKVGIGVPDPNDPIVELVSGEVGNLLAWTHYFFGKEFDKISPIIDRRLVEELNRRIVDIYLTRTDYWWFGFSDPMVNNWNPWCNFNALTVVLLTCPDAEKRIAATRLSLRSVDKFINYYKEDGACEEGPSYWESAGGKMMEYLELIKHATGGKINIFTNPLIENMGMYIANVAIGGEYYLNFADASAIFKGMPADIIYRYGKNVNSKELMAFGSYLYAEYPKPLSGNLDMMLGKIQIYPEMTATIPKPYFPYSFVCDGTQIAGARSEEGNNKGFFFGAKGGHNAESHNHNDIGTFVLYYNNDPIIIDAGVGTYTAKTFSSKRYEIWTMQSEYHNLPIVNGCGQRNGKSFKAANFKAGNKGKNFELSAEISGSYPTEAGIDRWTRSYSLNRTKGLSITDDFLLKRVDQPTQWVLIIAGDIKENGLGKLLLNGKKEKLQLQYDSKSWTYNTEEVPLDDTRLSNVWGSKVYRLVFTAKGTPTKGKYKFSITIP